MKRKTLFQSLFAVVALLCASSCGEQLTFGDIESPPVPTATDASARLLWIGPDYKVVVSAALEDQQGLTRLQVKNGEWQLNALQEIDNQTSHVVNDTFLVSKDVNPMEHAIELIITNSKGGILKTKLDVEDLSHVNQIEGYSPDILPPDITITKPTVTKFYGLDDVPADINIDIEAGIKDAGIATIEVRVWGETADGQSVLQEDLITPASETDKINYQYAKTFTVPGGKVGEYQYVVKSTDNKGNKAVKGGTITVGYVDRLYLSDAENASEVTNQAYESGGQCRGIGTLISMKKQGNNIFVADYYYRNESTDNIRFVAFMGTDRPFLRTTTAPLLNQRLVNYTIDGFNVLAMNASQSGKITHHLEEANFKLPVSQKGYYHLKVDMTARTIEAVPYTPAPLVDAVKYPSWSESNPWAYLAVTSNVIVGSGGGWYEAATSPKLMKEADHTYLFTGTFKTTGAVNISFNAPMSAINFATEKDKRGWFRLVDQRANMKDDYGDLISTVGPVGIISGGVNYGFSVDNAGTYKATYDIYLKRLRIIRTGS